MRKFGNERGIEIEAPHVEVAMMKAFFDLLDTTTILEVSNFPSEPVCPSCRSVGDGLSHFHAHTGELVTFRPSPFD